MFNLYNKFFSYLELRVYIVYYILLCMVYEKYGKYVYNIIQKIYISFGCIFMYIYISILYIPVLLYFFFWNQTTNWAKKKLLVNVASMKYWQSFTFVATNAFSILIARFGVKYSSRICENWSSVKSVVQINTIIITNTLTINRRPLWMCGECCWLH